MAFADGTRYERQLLPWAYMDWPKIAREIERFNAIAHPAYHSDHGEIGSA